MLFDIRDDLMHVIHEVVDGICVLYEKYYLDPFLIRAKLNPP
jgi:hypothetical protein